MSRFATSADERPKSNGGLMKLLISAPPGLKPSRKFEVALRYPSIHRMSHALGAWCAAPPQAVAGARARGHLRWNLKQLAHSPKSGARHSIAIGNGPTNVGHSLRPVAPSKHGSSNLTQKNACMSMSVFLVEDDPQLQVALGESINAVCDATVVGVADTENEALHWLNGHSGAWRLAVVDLYLKAGTGFGVLEKLIPPASRSRVIVLTNSATNENRNRCLSLGALAVYDKTHELHLFLDHCLRHHQQEQIGTNGSAE